MRTVDQTLAALRALPCGAPLFDALEGVEGVWLVGGAVRDLLLRGIPRELDLVVEDDVEAVASRLGEPVAQHDRFGTVRVSAGTCAYDLARARTETYAVPGALPDVEPGTLREDLRRRDFTVNAIAMSLAGEAPGELAAVPDALEDLVQRRLRVLHRDSFVDDPTRLWRLARYAARLGFEIEEHTDRWARDAVAAGALGTVSGDRIGNELRLMLAEPDPLAALAAAADLGLVEGLDLDRVVVDRARELLPEDARADLTILAVVAGRPPGHARSSGSIIEDAGDPGDHARPGPVILGITTRRRPADPREWLDALGFTASEREIVAAAVELAPLTPGRPSQVAAKLAGQPTEAVAAAGARGDAETAEQWLSDWRHVRLQITGDDLLAAGVSEGPEVGERLARALARKLDGELEPGREAELAAALD